MSLVIPFATSRHVGVEKTILSEYAYSLTEDRVVEQRVVIPSVPMGLTVANIPLSVQPDDSVEAMQIAGFAFRRVAHGLFSTNVAAFAGTDEEILPGTYVWCYSMTPMEGTQWGWMLSRGEDDGAGHTQELEYAVLDYFMGWILQRPDSRRCASKLRISWKFAIGPSVASEELYGRHLASSGCSGVGMGTWASRNPIERAAGPISLTLLGSTSAVTPEMAQKDICLPFILLDDNPSAPNEVTVVYVAPYGTIKSDTIPVQKGTRDGALALAAEAACKTWGHLSALLIWRRVRTAEARAWKSPMQRYLPAHMTVVIDWVESDVHLPREVGLMRTLVQAAVALMEETRASLKDCAHHVLNMRLKNRAEGRGRALVDSWIAQKLIGSGIVYVPWVGYDTMKREGPKQRPAKKGRGKRVAVVESPGALIREETCDGFEDPSIKRRAILLSSSSTGGELTRDMSYSSDSFSPVTSPGSGDSNAAMEVDLDDGDGGDIASVVPGIYWASPEADEVIVELDFRSYYPSLHIEYNLCPSSAASDLAPLPLPLALIDVVKRRLGAKEAKRTAMDTALKSLLVCIYGVPGDPRSCFYSPVMRSEAARRGREVIRKLRSELIQSYGAALLQSITDSVVCRIQRSQLDKFKASSIYYSPVGAHGGSGAWIRLGEPISMKAYWVVNEQARVWLREGQTDVAQETCKGVYPNYHIAHPSGANAFIAIADALLDPKRTRPQLVDQVHERLAECPGAVAHAVLRHLSTYCRVSMEHRWPGFLEDLRPLLQQHALEKVAHGLPQLAPEPDPFPIVDRFALLRIGAHLQVVKSCEDGKGHVDCTL